MWGRGCGGWTKRGVTLTEVLVASVVIVVVAAGTMLAFVTALRISQRIPINVEAASYAEQTLERYRNMIACDSAWFKFPCIAAATLPLNQNDPLALGALYGNGTRKFTVTSEDCDGVGAPGDCYKVAVTVKWTPPQ